MPPNHSLQWTRDVRRIVLAWSALWPLSLQPADPDAQAPVRLGTRSVRGEGINPVSTSATPLLSKYILVTPPSSLVCDAKLRIYGYNEIIEFG